MRCQQARIFAKAVYTPRTTSQARPSRSAQRPGLSRGSLSVGFFFSAVFSTKRWRQRRVTDSTYSLNAGACCAVSEHLRLVGEEVHWAFPCFSFPSSFFSSSSLLLLLHSSSSSFVCFGLLGSSPDTAPTTTGTAIGCQGSGSARDQPGQPFVSRP